MIIDSQGIKIEEYDIYKSRKCKRCNKIYDLGFISEEYFRKPYDYSVGFKEFCLGCWLLSDDEQIEVVENDEGLISNEFDIIFPDDHSKWYDTANYFRIADGDLNFAYKDYIKMGCHIVILPISRLHVDTTIFNLCGMLVFPKGILSFEKYKFDENSIFDDYEYERYEGENLTKFQSFLSGVTIEDYKKETLIALPIKFDWNKIYKCMHSDHMSFIRSISDVVDEIGLKYLKYKNCDLDYTLETSLPSYAGQLSNNLKMSSCLLINGNTNELKLIGGNAYSQYFTSGVGIKINQPEWNDFPKNGEVGNIVSHALTLYIQMLQTQSLNSRYVQALSLLEYLAFPQEYKNFKEVKKIIAKYVAKDISHRDYLYERFKELTGKKDDVTNEEIGLRTLIVHIGGNIETLLEKEDRKKVFLELDSYIREIIDFMIIYSDMDYNDYFENKVKMGVKTSFNDNSN